MTIANARVNPGQLLVSGIQLARNVAKRGKRHYFLEDVRSAVHRTIIPNALTLEWNIKTWGARHWHHTDAAIRNGASLPPYLFVPSPPAHGGYRLAALIAWDHVSAGAPTGR